MMDSNFESKLMEFLTDRLEVPFKNIDLYIQAFTHKSYSNEVALTDNITILDYDRLEYYGDAVLYIAATDLTYARYETSASGDLSKIRKSLINGSVLSVLAKDYNLEELIRYSKGETKNSHHDKIQEDVFESLIGAVSLDLGLAYGIELCKKILLPHLLKNEQSACEDDYKTALQQLLEKEMRKLPRYVCVEEKMVNGNDHLFTIHVMVDDIVLGVGKGSSKKIGEMMAAKDALTKRINVKGDNYGFN